MSLTFWSIPARLPSTILPLSEESVHRCRRQAYELCLPQAEASIEATNGWCPPVGQEAPALPSALLTKVGEDLLDYHRGLNAGDDPHHATAGRAGLDVDAKYPFQALCPGHVRSYIFDHLKHVFEVPINGSRRVIVPSNPPPLLLPHQRGEATRCTPKRSPS